MNYLVIILILILTYGCASSRNEANKSLENNNEKTVNNKVAVIENQYHKDPAKAEGLSQSDIEGASDSAFSKKNNDPLGIQEVVKKNGQKIAQKFQFEPEIINIIPQSQPISAKELIKLERDQRDRPPSIDLFF